MKKDEEYDVFTVNVPASKPETRELMDPHIDLMVQRVTEGIIKPWPESTKEAFLANTPEDKAAIVSGLVIMRMVEKIMSAHSEASTAVLYTLMRDVMAMALTDPDVQEQVAAQTGAQISFKRNLGGPDDVRMSPGSDAKN